jgi:hypothetical protein
MGRTMREILHCFSDRVRGDTAEFCIRQKEIIYASDLERQLSQPQISFWD